MGSIIRVERAKWKELRKNLRDSNEKSIPNNERDDTPTHIAARMGSAERASMLVMDSRGLANPQHWTKQRLQAASPRLSVQPQQYSAITARR